MIPVENLTHFPEMLGGRVKTLHPGVHAALLADKSNEDHMKTLSTHGIRPIDMVVCNFYDFGKAALQRGITEAALMEMIDIGGSTIVMAGAKNFGSVCVVPSIEHYKRVAEELDRNDGKISYATRHGLMLDAVRIVANDRSLIADVLGSRTAITNEQPNEVRTKQAR